MGKPNQLETADLTEGQEIPRIIVGAWQFSEGHNVDPAGTDDAIKALSAYADAGFTTFDCADIYTGVEELLGAFLRHHSDGSRVDDRRDVRVHTKFVPDRDVLPQISRSYVEKIIDRSLRRLGIEQLDLVQFAWWDYDIPGYVETAHWLHELQRAGKIRHLGVTNFDVPRLGEIVDSGVPVVSHQLQYSLLDHRPEGGMVDFCDRRGIQVLSYGTVAGGFLSERWLGTVEPTGQLPNRSLTKYKLMIDEFGGWEAFQNLLEILADIASRYNAPMSAIATRYILQRPRVAAAIVGARNTDHLADARQTLALRLDERDTARLHEFAAPRSAQGDVYALEREPESTHAAIMRYNLNRAN